MTRRLEPGLYETLITEGLRQAIESLSEEGFLSEQKQIDPAEAPRILALHFEKMLEFVLKTEKDNKKKVQLYNKLLATIARNYPKITDYVKNPVLEVCEQLLSVTASDPLVAQERLKRPGIPISESALLVNARGEHRVGAEICSEIASADRIDLICSFLKWSGYRLLRNELKDHLQRQRKLRILTTCYMGATEQRVLDDLVERGADLRVSYETKRTRLHAKAWLFHRDTGYTTAYIGSSNLSHAALSDGLEWNVRLSAIENPEIIKKFEATFEHYWLDGEFEAYDPRRDHERFRRATNAQSADTSRPLLALDVNPYPFQEEILDELLIERHHKNNWKNLVVAATGTGKTVLAALDYKRMRPDINEGKLLYIAHRKEILQKSMDTFRIVLKDPSFGELLAGGQRTTHATHVFASVQSLKNIPLDQIAPGAFDMVIVDEIHHGAAPTYQCWLEHLNPRLLLGLTATPERMDGQSILPWFNDHISSELRLWEALERELLSPFQYFGISDDTDLTQVAWRSGRYDTHDLENLFTGDDARVKRVARALQEKVLDVSQIRALAFCVSVSHAEFMATKFSNLGIRSEAISGQTSPEVRDGILGRLKKREINVICAVDLFNEGIDLPEIDTVLFLRPTESATLFLQQLGRGLRRAERKECLTVLDFIGLQNRQFRYDLRFRAMTGTGRGGLVKQIEQGFPRLPSGCSIILDEQSQKNVLKHIQRSLKTNSNALAHELAQMGKDTTLVQFLKETGTELEDLYKNGRSWSTLRRDAGFSVPEAGPRENTLRRNIARMAHIDDHLRLNWIQEYISSSTPPKSIPSHAWDLRLAEMLHVDLWGYSNESGQLLEGLREFWRHIAIRDELQHVIEVLRGRISRLGIACNELPDIPLTIHCRYSLYEISAALDISSAERPYKIREGVYFSKAHRSDLFFITLQKSDKDYSPSTMYNDYAISPDLFHWESQSMTSEDSQAGQRYQSHESQGSHVFLFIREKKIDEYGKTMPYLFLGPAVYQSHVSERPMQITWKLLHRIPARFFTSMALKAG